MWTGPKAACPHAHRARRRPAILSVGFHTKRRGAGFANQVIARNFDPTNLFVHVAEVNVDTGEHNDLENILNRINYPIFGRN
jgi:hypothetical protein